MLWQKIVIRAIGIPGYGALFAAWVFVLGLLGAVLYLWLTEPVVIQDTSASQGDSGLLTASALETLLMAVVAVVAWAGVAYFCGKIVRWIAKILKIHKKSLTALKLTLLISGSLVFALAMSLAFSEEYYIFLLVSAGMIAIGSLSFALEAACLQLWRLKADTTW